MKTTLRATEQTLLGTSSWSISYSTLLLVEWSATNTERQAMRLGKCDEVEKTF